MEEREEARGGVGEKDGMTGSCEKREGRTREAVSSAQEIAAEGRSYPSGYRCSLEGRGECQLSKKEEETKSHEP